MWVPEWTLNFYFTGTLLPITKSRNVWQGMQSYTWQISNLPINGLCLGTGEFFCWKQKSSIADGTQNVIAFEWNSVSLWLNLFTSWKASLTLRISVRSSVMTVCILQAKHLFLLRSKKKKEKCSMTNSVPAEGAAVTLWTAGPKCSAVLWGQGLNRRRASSPAVKTLGTWHKTQARTLALPPLRTSEDS